MSFGTNLRMLRKEKGLTQLELANIFSLGESTISFYESDKREPDYETLSKFANYFDVPIDFLLGRIKTRRPIEEYIENRKERGLPTDNLVFIEDVESVTLPLVGTVAAGTPILAEENIEKYIAFPKPFAKNATFALRVKGNSMKGVGIHDGDIVFVKQQPEAENGQIVIARVDGEVTCKKFLKTDSKIILLPANEEFEPIESDNVEVVGIVISATRMF